jgi:hypothetical protein
MDLKIEREVVAGKARSRSALHVVLTISLLCGPLAYLIWRAISESFAGGGQGLALAAFSVIGFEVVWLTYGFIALVNKGLKGR